MLLFDCHDTIKTSKDQADLWGEPERLWGGGGRIECGDMKIIVEHTQQTYT